MVVQYRAVRNNTRLITLDLSLHHRQRASPQSNQSIVLRLSALCDPCVRKQRAVSALGRKGRHTYRPTTVAALRSTQSTILRIYYRFRTGTGAAIKNQTTNYGTSAEYSYQLPTPNTEHRTPNTKYKIQNTTKYYHLLVCLGILSHSSNRIIIIMGDYYGRASSSGDASTPKASRGAAPASGLDQGKIFVGGLSWQTTEESLRWHFEQYGPVVSVEVMKDRVTGDPRGFAFVVFQDGATVDLVMAEPNHEINHKIVDVKRAQARGIAPPSIHIKGEGEGQPEGEPVQSNDNTNDNNNNNNNVTSSSNNNSNHMSPEQQGTKVFVGGT
jgi:hypothetical protein